MKNLELMGVQEMDAKELKEKNGGLLWQALVVAAFVEIISDWDNFKRGIQGLPEQKK
jgi:hypothetical protein